MNRFLAIILCSLVLQEPSWANAGSVPRVAVLVSHDSPQSRQVLAGFQADFAEHDQKADFIVATLGGSAEDAQEMVSGLRGERIDLVFALGAQALESAGALLTDIPVVASMVLNKEDISKYPNATGVSLAFSIEDQLDWLQKILPQSRNIGVIYSSAENRELVERASKIIKKSGLTLHQVQIDSPGELTPALKQLENRADVLWGLNDKMVLNKATAQSVLLFSLRNKIPFVGLSSAWVKAGAVYALEWDYQDLGRQGAEMARRILSGQRPADVRVASPRAVQYSLNLKVADRLKLDFPDHLLDNAVTVF
ncbi:MAG: ABC transporter substrate-binding protein [Desulfuromonadales bacterium]|nr:ABC transporter substrate-binding protein [Desulfuromonadales bacterium]